MEDRKKRKDEIRRRCMKASAGPWRRLIGNEWRTVRSDGDHRRVATDVSPADGEFIAHARQDIPWLLAQVDRLEAELRAEKGEQG